MRSRNIPNCFKNLKKFKYLQCIQLNMTPKKMCMIPVSAETHSAVLLIKVKLGVRTMDDALRTILKFAVENMEELKGGRI